MQACAHCHESVDQAIYDKIKDPELTIPFCCQGCLTVYQVIHQKGFGDYYTIKEEAGIIRRRAPAVSSKEAYLYLDDEHFLKEYTQLSSQGERRIEFYLEGIHCLACLWLIEKLPELHCQILSSKLDIERSVVEISLLADAQLSQVATLLRDLGYKPHAIKSSEDQRRLKTKEERRELLRIGIAAAGASNIMIYAVSLYAGADELYAQVFNILTILFAFPVMTYSAWGFYQNSWNALKNRVVSIDVPISMALIMGLLVGIYNAFVGVNENYLDSLTTLVFLLLLSRYFLKKIQERALRVQDLDFFHHNVSVLKAVNSDLSEFKEVHSKYLMPQDVIKLMPGQFIPADGVILQGKSHTNNSLLTGESAPQTVSIGDAVYSGTQNLDQVIQVKVISVGEGTRLGSLLKNLTGGWSQKSQILELTHKISQYFISCVLILALAIFVYKLQTSPLSYALEIALTLLIVTCPCALALAIPLTFSRSLSAAAQNGILIKSDAVLEKLTSIKDIFVDKTGTLTQGKMQITEMEILAEPKILLADILYNLEKKSQHPLAISLCEYALKQQACERQVEEWLETTGVGVVGTIEGQKYEIKDYQVFENNKAVAKFRVSDPLRSDCEFLIKKLKENFEVHILSGDKFEIVDSIARKLDIENFQAQCSPEDKSATILKHKDSLMIGDGANDSIALAHAKVGIAVHGSMALSLKASDVYLVTPGLSALLKLFSLSAETMKVIKRNIALSLIYNSVSVVAVFSGYITPLIAAIIMPLSSLTVLASTLWSTKKLRVLWK
jgi:heavy metal translocating P-type ATPase